ncbi:MAG: DUF2161 family putative PD-(D/E)XK-type phosphodiesterase [Pseudomonadota bacterium]
MSAISETDLYAPVKAWLEALGYQVKAEVGAADVVALRDGEVPLIVELKTGFSLTLLQQAVARQAVTDAVYVAVPRWVGKAGWRAFKGNIGLCRRLGLGVLSVRLADGVVQVHCDPVPFQPRKSKRKREALLREFALRQGDPNAGGTRGKIVTAYRQDAERLVAYLCEAGPSSGAAARDATGVVHATRMMADNHYGWFRRVSRGVYHVTEEGRAEGLRMKDSEQT